MRQGEMRKAFVEPLTESSRVALAACWCAAPEKKNYGYRFQRKLHNPQAWQLR